jgi:hypothetical protein
MMGLLDILYGPSHFGRHDSFSSQDMLGAGRYFLST